MDDKPVNIKEEHNTQENYPKTRRWQINQWIHHQLQGNKRHNLTKCYIRLERINTTESYRNPEQTHERMEKVVDNAKQKQTVTKHEDEQWRSYVVNSIKGVSD